MNCACVFEQFERELNNWLAAAGCERAYSVSGTGKTHAHTCNWFVYKLCEWVWVPCAAPELVVLTFLPQIALGRDERVVQHIVHMAVVGLEYRFRLLDVHVLCGEMKRETPPDGQADRREINWSNKFIYVVYADRVSAIACATLRRRWRPQYTRTHTIADGVWISYARMHACARGFARRSHRPHTHIHARTTCWADSRRKRCDDLRGACLRSGPVAGPVFVRGFRCVRDGGGQWCKFEANQKPQIIVLCMFVCVYYYCL